MELREQLHHAGSCGRAIVCGWLIWCAIVAGTVALSTLHLPVGGPRAAVEAQYQPAAGSAAVPATRAPLTSASRSAH